MDLNKVLTNRLARHQYFMVSIVTTASQRDLFFAFERVGDLTADLSPPKDN